MEKVTLVDQEVIEAFLACSKTELEGLKKKKRKTKTDFLVIEYLKTFIMNPTPMNYILISCGRADEMKRKEEEDV